MAFRIDVETDAVRRVIRFDGVLDVEAVDELQTILAAESPNGQSSRLDLGGTRFADGAGVAFLRNAERSGVELTGVSGFVRELLLTAERGDPREQPA